MEKLRMRRRTYFLIFAFAAIVILVVGFGCSGGASAVWFKDLPSLTVSEPESLTPRVFVLDPALLSLAKQRLAEGDETTSVALARLIKCAERALDAGPFTVMDNFHMAASGDPHDYHSIMIYAWPNQWTGRPYYIRDGKRNPDLHEYDLPRVNGMVSSVRNLALAYFFTEDPRFAEHAAFLLRTWFLDPETRMNPNLRYAQALPGLTSGTWIGIIEGMRIPRDAIDVIGLIQPSGSWTEEDQVGMEAWCSEYLDWLQKSLFGRLEHRARNNHGTWYDVQVVILALFLDDIELARNVLAQHAPRRLYRQVKPDGRQPKELERADPLAYTRYNLEAWLDLASLGKRVGVDLWNYTGPDERSIRRATEYMLTEFPNAPTVFLHRIEVEFDPDRKWLDEAAAEVELDHAEGLRPLLLPVGLN